jgi:hypothetical protein
MVLSIRTTEGTPVKVMATRISVAKISSMFSTPASASRQGEDGERVHDALRAQHLLPRALFWKISMVDIDEILAAQFKPLGYKSTIWGRGHIIILKSRPPDEFAWLSNARALSSLHHAHCRRCVRLLAVLSRLWSLMHRTMDRRIVKSGSGMR